MIDWIKRAVRWPWFGPKRANLPMGTLEPSTWTGLHQGYPVVVSPLFERPEYLEAAREATIAQKNVRLASIARTRGKLKDEIARLKRNKKRHLHLAYELARLTRMELELESGK